MPFDGETLPETSASLIILDAMHRIVHERNWCQKITERTANGVQQYCVIGAVYAGKSVPWMTTIRRALEAMQMEARARGFEVVSELNDKSTHAEVIAFMRAAYQRAKLMEP